MTHLDRTFKYQMKKSSNHVLDPARPIGMAPIPSASHKPSHQLRTVFVVLMLTRNFLPPLHPSASNSTPPCQSRFKASDCVFPPSPTTILGRSWGIGNEQWKSKVPKVYPIGRSVARRKGSEALKVHVSSGAQAVSDSTITMIQVNHKTPSVVPLHQDDSMRLR